MNIDQTLLLFIQDYLRSDLLTGLLCTITVLGNKGAIWLAFLLMLLIYPRTRKLGLLAGLSLLVCVSLGEALKYPHGVLLFHSLDYPLVALIRQGALCRVRLRPAHVLFPAVCGGSLPF